MARVFLTLFVSLPLILKAEPQEAKAAPQDAKVYFDTVCSACHGTKGEGKQEMMAPSIGGLPAWFVELQMNKFQQGLRGVGPDHSGAVMRTIALALPPESIPSLANYVASLKPHPTQGETPENLQRVEELYYESCAPCHRFNGHGERVFKSAPISLLPDWYLKLALTKFRDGIRGTHPHDESGAKMREITGHLSDEIIADLASYISVLAERYPPGERRRRIMTPEQARTR